MYSDNVTNSPSTYVQYDIQEYEQNDSFDETDYYTENRNQEHSNGKQGGCTICGQEMRPFYKPSTSSQADEDDHEVELFHKNILVFSTERIPICGVIDIQDEQPAITCISSCNNEEYCAKQSVSSSHPLVINTGYSQSAFTDSLTLTSPCVQTDYIYGNQSEYVSTEFSFRKRCALSNVPIDYDDVSAVTTASKLTNNDAHSLSDSVLQLTDCSSLKFNESPK